MIKLNRRNKAAERGSLSLELMMYISAVVLVSGGVIAFFTDIGGFFEGFDAPTRLQIEANPAQPE